MMLFDESILLLWSGPRLALLVFAALLLACMVPLAARARTDTRVLHGVGVWIKPLKFLAALALFALTTAALMLFAADAPALTGVALLVIVTSSFEAGYISYRASRGELSHYNASSTRARMFTLAMAVGAIGLSASQAWLAWLIVREHSDVLGSAATLGAVLGLVLTFVLSTVSGFMLAGRRAPPGSGARPFGWHRQGDLRPGHFLGVHAQQFIPVFGLLAQRLCGPAAVPVLGVLTSAYVLAWLMGMRVEASRIGPIVPTDQGVQAAPDR